MVLFRTCQNLTKPHVWGRLLLSYFDRDNVRFHLRSGRSGDRPSTGRNRSIGATKADNVNGRKPVLIGIETSALVAGPAAERPVN